MDDATLQLIREHVARRSDYRSLPHTHYDRCVGHHVDCALSAMLAEVDRLRDGIVDLPCTCEYGAELDDAWCPRCALLREGD
ncbi:MAG TPA: hypothetical protein VIG24_03050 [Acidimicrobiia bacterium]